MSHKQMIRSFALMCACLLALPSGRALSCCRRDLSNGSTACELSNTPDPSCDTHWSADGIMVVDETGETDLTRVLHAEPHTLVLRGKHTELIFQMDCADLKSVMLFCKDLCDSPADPQHSNIAVNRSTCDGVFIIFVIFIIFIFTG